MHPETLKTKLLQSNNVVNYTLMLITIGKSLAKFHVTVVFNWSHLVTVISFKSTKKFPMLIAISAEKLLSDLKATAIGFSVNIISRFINGFQVNKCNNTASVQAV